MSTKEENETNEEKTDIVIDTKMASYLEKRFCTHDYHVLFYICIDNTFVDIYIKKQYGIHFDITVVESEYHVKRSKKNIFYEMKNINNVEKVVKSLKTLLQMKFDKNSNAFTEEKTCDELEFLTYYNANCVEHRKCAVCLEYFLNNNTVFNCSHTFCILCETNVKKTNSCPLCRASLNFYNHNNSSIFDLLNISNEEDNDDDLYTVYNENYNNDS